MITDSTQDYSTGVITLIAEPGAEEIHAWDYLRTSYGMHPSDGELTLTQGTEYKGLVNPLTYTFTQHIPNWSIRNHLGHEVGTVKAHADPIAAYACKVNAGTHRLVAAGYTAKSIPNGTTT
jgi:hypothetical protein